MNNYIELYKKEEECCGCGACNNICPTNAISMVENDRGFLYPKIDEKTCIKCGLCKTVCAFQNAEVSNVPLKTYVAVDKDKESLKKSASGGVFTALARNTIKNDGIVVGAVLDKELNPIHKIASKVEDLYPMQGSKYVQSEIGMVYKETKKYLIEGYHVLFSGTPCQVAGLYGYLKKDYNNLITIDIICHGVPSAQFFSNYIKVLNKKLNGNIVEFSFRDKNIGWGLNGSVIYKKQNVLKKKKIFSGESSYYNFFSNASCYRESCYSCKYAGENRPADITIGDYWGIEKAHPDLLKNKEFREKEGISVVIANSKKGLLKITECGNLRLSESDFIKAIAMNKQLQHPSKKSKEYEEIMDLYKNSGYEALEKYFIKKSRFKRYESRIKTLIPIRVKRMLKRKF